MHQTSDINQFLDGIASGPSAVFAIFFAISFGLHVWQSTKYRSWPFTWPLPCACILMMSGFICREIVAEKNDADDLASAVQGLFYSATPVFTLPLYTFLLCSSISLEVLPWLSQVISYIGIWIFTSAVISLTAQGCATYFNPDATRSSVHSSLALLKASLFLQLATDGALLALLVSVFLGGYGHLRKNSTANSSVDGTGASEPDLERHRSTHMLIFSLFVLMDLIVVRNVFRTVQIFASPLSPLWTREVYFWVFEACVMLAYTALFHVLHPGRHGALQYRRRGRCAGSCRST